MVAIWIQGYVPVKVPVDATIGNLKNALRRKNPIQLHKNDMGANAAFHGMVLSVKNIGWSLGGGADYVQFMRYVKQQIKFGCLFAQIIDETEAAITRTVQKQRSNSAPPERAVGRIARKSRKRDSRASMPILTIQMLLPAMLRRNAAEAEEKRPSPAPT